MNRIIAVFIFMLCAATADAQTRRSFKDIDQDLKQAKSTATAMALINSIGETEPQTDEDIRILGQLMDSYPREGQRALSRAKNPKLANAVMKECDREVAKFKADKDKDWKNLPEAQRQEKFNALLNTQAIMATLGNLKSREALPYLKQYITPEYDGTLSYTASQAIGRIAPDDPAVFKELWDKQGVKSISYSAYGKSVLREVAEKMQDPNVPKEEKNQILAKAKPSLLSGMDPAEKKLIKDILLYHPNRDLKGEVGGAMVHAVINNPEESDKDFVVEWVKKEKSLAVWNAPYVMDRVWDVRFIPILLEMLKNPADWMPKGNVAQLLARRQVKEALPSLAECIEKDKEENVRAECRDSYYKITGKMPVIFHPNDVAYFEKQFKDPYTIDFYSKLKSTDPEKKRQLALKASLEEFKRGVGK
ncbi:MAG: hypothetical protein A2X35_03795 [Elusimicrobia bacterium GWA2_61_42]|nr:MAG: hypothetical protein A2X35_03795 [Elusimicrobia bacterium GWA2_61_42]OGR77703.1 MAG: hypothetical protein A2X38_10035 [Elusimicrobia bacterium GWC2_61_25]